MVLLAFTSIIAIAAAASTTVVLCARQKGDSPPAPEQPTPTRAVTLKPISRPRDEATSSPGTPVKTGTQGTITDASSNYQMPSFSGTLMLGSSPGSPASLSTPTGASKSPAVSPYNKP
ncbi:hypothetical protein QR680_008067 [Steinernema hermaphroditum]|uniref:Uncharacterized protein n=1 Tax=Steinernema hermaphroditum TaxID=289476 RepID=A0AA39M7E9_9BILA|nr:hypothetical protein QR680_008067 [Steinernema hermaphroditum]